MPCTDAAHDERPGLPGIVVGSVAEAEQCRSHAVRAHTLSCRLRTHQRPQPPLKKRLPLAFRYDKSATVYLAALHIAGIFICPQADPEDTI
ncbi:hypothetical protein A6A06_38555 [Streptomyces sp. CB02923]|uniref:hypothetical protein n=1 Tax=Streptomyces sp. CB02923 TaxID=1718985 RepID=UPI00093EA6AB|nr:hypothetical protein [Streptomyces sp. CB02923]OKI06081.1 hypothetical protein A6A06_38555 [Streptomyces sp. CB02923]